MRYFKLSRAVLAFCLVSCSTIQGPNHLVPNPDIVVAADVPWQCLVKAQQAEKSRERIYESDRALLRGADTRRFLWWISPNDVRPLADSAGRPSMHPSSANESYASRELSDHYVLCLLRSGFMWPPLSE